MSAIATIISICNGLWTLVGNLFGKKSAAASENTQAVEVANKAGALAAAQSRATRAQTETDLDANHAQTTADLAAVDHADSLHDGAAAINQDIARTRAHAGADR